MGNFTKFLFTLVLLFSTAALPAAAGDYPRGCDVVGCKHYHVDHGNNGQDAAAMVVIAGFVIGQALGANQQPYYQGQPPRQWYPGASEPPRYRDTRYPGVIFDKWGQVVCRSC